MAQRRVKWHASKMTRQAKCLPIAVSKKSRMDPKAKHESCNDFRFIKQQKGGIEWLFIPYLLLL